MIEFRKISRLDNDNNNNINTIKKEYGACFSSSSFEYKRVVIYDFFLSYFGVSNNSLGNDSPTLTGNIFIFKWNQYVPKLKIFFKTISVSLKSKWISRKNTHIYFKIRICYCA